MTTTSEHGDSGGETDAASVLRRWSMQTQGFDFSDRVAAASSRRLEDGLVLLRTRQRTRTSHLRIILGLPLDLASFASSVPFSFPSLRSCPCAFADLVALDGQKGIAHPCPHPSRAAATAAQRSL